MTRPLAYTPLTELPAYYNDIPRRVRRAVFRPPAAAHGTRIGYYGYACDCPRCRAAGRDYRAQLEQEHRDGYRWRGRIRLR